MSLRTLFLLMGLVSALMIAGVIYMKVLHPSHVSMAERRSIDRMCDTHCSMIAEDQAKLTSGDEELMRAARKCVSDCVARMIVSRQQRPGLR